MNLQKTTTQPTSLKIDDLLKNLYILRYSINERNSDFNTPDTIFYGYKPFDIHQSFPTKKDKILHLLTKTGIQSIFPFEYQIEIKIDTNYYLHSFISKEKKQALKKYNPNYIKKEYHLLINKYAAKTKLKNGTDIDIQNKDCMFSLLGETTEHISKQIQTINKTDMPMGETKIKAEIITIKECLEEGYDII